MRLDSEHLRLDPDRALKELRERVSGARWFERLGQFPGSEGVVPLADLLAWGGGEEDSPIADEMDWLPTSREQPDPIYEDALEVLAEQLGKRDELRRETLESYKLALASLRGAAPAEALKVGPHDFTESAKAAAAYAIRRATAEIVVGAPAFWCRTVDLYGNGYWPCGLLASGDLVVL